LKPLFNYDFSKRVILDTNTLLNATFNRGGLAAHAISVLRRMATPVYVTPSIEAEVGRVSERLKRKYRLGYDPAQAVRTVLRAQGILFAPPPRGPPIAHVNKVDEPIARAARHLGAAIITDDIEFIVEARAAGIEAWQYWEVSRSYSGDGELPDLSKVVRYGAPNGKCGYIFVRAVPGSWAGLKIEERFSICEISEGLWLYYDGLSEHWKVQTSAGEIVRLSMPLENDGHYIVGVNLRPTEKGCHIALMAAKQGGQEAIARADVRAVGKGIGNSELSIGHNRHQLEHWNGAIKDLVVASGSLPPRTFRLLASTEDLSPNPADSDTLAEAVQRVITLVR
jgi:predicted nucleic acid-binding protein